MKLLMSLLVSSLLLSSCSLIDKLSGKLEDATPGSRLFSDRLLTAATPDTLMNIADLFDDHGSRCFLNKGDQIRVRYFDLQFQSHEFTFTAATTLDTLLGQISGAASVSLAMDTTGSGAVLITGGGEGKQNLVVENLTNPRSQDVIAKLLWWPGLASTATRSQGCLLKIADTSSSLLTLRDSSGATLNLETDDTIIVNGDTPEGPIPSSFRLVVGDRGMNMKAICDLLDSAIDKSAPSFGNTYAENEKGRLSIQMKDGMEMQYTVKLLADNSDNDYITPSKFNGAFIFHPNTDSF